MLFGITVEKTGGEKIQCGQTVGHMNLRCRGRAVLQGEAPVWLLVGCRKGGRLGSRRGNTAKMLDGTSAWMVKSPGPGQDLGWSASLSQIQKSSVSGLQGSSAHFIVKER